MSDQSFLLWNFFLQKAHFFQNCWATKWTSGRVNARIHSWRINFTEISLWGFSISLIENVNKFLIFIYLDFPWRRIWFNSFKPSNIFNFMSKIPESRSPLESLKFWDSRLRTPTTQKQGLRDSGLRTPDFTSLHRTLAS